MKKMRTKEGKKCTINCLKIVPTALHSELDSLFGLFFDLFLPRLLGNVSALIFVPLIPFRFLSEERRKRFPKINRTKVTLDHFATNASRLSFLNKVLLLSPSLAVVEDSIHA